MLALMLSGVVGLASLVFFFSAFFAPKLHRKDDFLWSGFGCFYALVLWICAQRFTGAILLGQLAGVCLILAFAWQTLRLRAAVADHAIAEKASFSLLDWVGGGLKRKPKTPTVEPTPETSAPAHRKADPYGIAKQETQEETVAEKTIDKVDQVLESIEAPPPVVEAVEEIVEEAIAKAETEAATPASSPPDIKSPPVPPTPAKAAIPEQPKAAKDDLPKKPKSKLFQWLFWGKKQAKPSTQPANIADVIESADEDWGEEETVEEVVTKVEDAVEEVVAEQELEEATTETEAAVEEIVAAVEEAVEDAIQPGENTVDAAIAIEPHIEAESLWETVDSEADPPEITEVVESEPQPDPEPLANLETVNAEPENLASETEATEDLPAIPATMDATEDSNWDDFDQEFDPYFGWDDTSTKLENQGTVHHGEQSATEETPDAPTDDPDAKTTDPA